MGSEVEEVKMPPKPRIRPPLDRECVVDTVVTDVVVVVVMATAAVVDVGINAVPTTIDVPDAGADADTGTNAPSPCRW